MDLLRGVRARRPRRVPGPDAAGVALSWIGGERIAISGVPSPRGVPHLAEQGVTHVVNCRPRAQVQTSSPQTFTLANTGGQATGALTDTLTGAAAFTVTGDTCTGISLAAGGTCTVTVRFAPASIATDTATLTAASANPAVTATAALTGTGVRPRFLYWTDQIGTASGTVSVIPLTGVGTPTTLVTGQASPAGVAVDASHIYWGTVATR